MTAMATMACAGTALVCAAAVSSSLPVVTGLVYGNAHWAVPALAGAAEGGLMLPPGTLAMGGVGVVGAGVAAEEMVTLYHGTTGSAASRIARNGFRLGADAAAFFAEDFATAQHFALDTAAARGATNATVLRFQVPKSVFEQLQRGVIGEFRGLPFVDIPASSGFELILQGDVNAFNEAISGMRRIPVGGM